MIHGTRPRLAFEQLENRRLLAGNISLIRHFDTWDGGVIRSTDIAGIAFHPPSGNLYLADSEINEIPSIFNGDNIFETSLLGDRVFREIASNNTEPTGITYNEFDGFFYVTNDTGSRLVTRYDDKLNNPLLEVSTEDAVRSASDPEGITSDPSTGFLYVVDGNDGGLQVLAYDSDLQFQYVFSVANRMADAEGIAFHAPSNHLFVLDSKNDNILEYTLTGSFVEEYSIGGFSPTPYSPQGATFAPTSDPNDDPSALSLYIADGMKDNFPDGRVYEARIGEGTIGDNDPDVSINDVSAREGNLAKGKKNGGNPTYKDLQFTISLSHAVGHTVTVDYATADGTATTANSDYQATSGTLIFLAGETSKTMVVTVVGDNTSESDETFSVMLDNAQGGNVLDGEGTGTILDDDTKTNGKGGGKKMSSEAIVTEVEARDPIRVFDPVLAASHVEHLRYDAGDLTTQHTVGLELLAEFFDFVVSQDRWGEPMPQRLTVGGDVFWALFSSEPRSAEPAWSLDLDDPTHLSLLEDVFADLYGKPSDSIGDI